MARACFLAIAWFAILAWSDERLLADSMVYDITSPRQCDSYLKVTSKPAQDGLVEFVVRIQPEEAAHAGELYRGRVATLGNLSIASAESVLATMLLHKAMDKDVAEFRFELTPALAQGSVLTINTYLYEKDGIGTVGGSNAFKIHLNGFLPGR